MGYNTTALLYNDQSDRWPEAIREAMQSWQRHENRRNFDEKGHFGFGQIVACDHADHSQVCVVGQNSGRFLTPVSPLENPADLQVLAQILRAHGASVRLPHEKRAKPPLKWGYAAHADT
ncbi:hypothetical protein [Dinoroseobacter sp. S375]|uniref:hypothetical protein n=1 Tax=Dinoroseobacter sp. S375 TaxID=3415136 RepID=UPI003C79D5E1